MIEFHMDMCVEKSHPKYLVKLRNVVGKHPVTMSCNFVLRGDLTNDESFLVTSDSPQC